MQDLRSEVDDPAIAAAVETDWRTADLPKSTQCALEYAEKLTERPSEMTRADVRALRAHGFTDEDIHDIVQITAYFNYINRIADALGVPPESNMKPWDRENGA